MLEDFMNNVGIHYLGNVTRRHCAFKSKIFFTCVLDDL
jgi:hypothetical protein